MKLKALSVIVIIVVGRGLAAAGDDPSMDYSTWRNKPRERFSDPERAFQQVKAILLKEYIDQNLTEEDLYRAAVAGMLSGAGGRKWDKLMYPTEYAEIKGDLRGEFVGIGIEIKFDEDSGMTTVLATVPGAPAERAGLQRGDKILKIDGKSFKGQNVRDVANAIRGRAGSAVTLTFLREDKIIQKSVVRAAITFAPVMEMMLPGQIGLITLRAFTEKTPAQLRATLARLKQRGVRGLVLDLRNNEGGVFENVVEAAGALLPKGTLVVTAVGRSGKEDPHRTTTSPVVTGVPVSVIVSKTTASGAEIFAAALKHGLGAKVVGKRTHGKWNVQRIAELPNRYAFKYTVGVFKSPAGELLDGKGLDPDLEIDMDDEACAKAQLLRGDPRERLDADPQLRSAVSILRL